MRVLMTGGTGFVGSHIVWSLIHAGHEVTLFVRDSDRVPSGIRALDPNLVVGDLTQLTDFSELVSGHETVIHAALVWSDDPSQDQADLEVSRRLFEACAVRRANAVYLSSAAVHRPFSMGMTEASATYPVDSYGLVKIGAEAFLQQSGLRRWVALRPGPVVGGPACKGAQVRVPRRIEEFTHKEGVARLSKGDGRQLTSVSALAHSVIRFIEADVPSGPYIVMDEGLTTWSEIATRITELMGVQIEVEFGGQPVEPPHSFSVTRWVENFGSFPSSAVDLDAMLRWIAENGEGG